MRAVSSIRFQYFKKVIWCPTGVHHPITKSLRLFKREVVWTNYLTNRRVQHFLLPGEL